MNNIDWKKIRGDFPILSTKYNDKQLVYFDNAATSQKPLVVINEIEKLYKEYNANIHRGIYRISEIATQRYIESKEKVAKLIKADSYQEIIYTKNTTDSINTIALMLEKEISEGDEILISIMEHHSNLIPWMKLAERKNAKLVYVGINKDGEIDIEDLKNKISNKTKVLSITHISNVLGTINPIKDILKLIKERNIYTIVDGAQAVGHIDINVKDLDCDFYVFSGHKMLGPVGIGVLYAKKEFLERHDPVFFGGDMISNVYKYSIEYNELPWKFEAGTSNFEGGIGLGIAIDYINEIGIGNISSRNEFLLKILESQLSELNGIRIYGNSKNKSSVLSFRLDNVHPHDIASLLDRDNICIRAGYHCAQPLIESLECNSLARASLHFYNNEEDIEIFIKSLRNIREIFNGK